MLLVVNEAFFFISHRLPIALGALDAGYKVHVATYGSSEEIAAIQRMNLQHHWINLQRGRINPLVDLRTVAELWVLYRRLRPDVVHHVTIKPVVYGGMVARIQRLPAVVNALTGLGFTFTNNGLKAKLVRIVTTGLLRFVARHANSRFIFQNRDDRTAMERAGVGSGKAVLIRGSGVDVTKFCPGPEPQGPPVVMFASRMLWDKGPGVFVEAARCLLGCGVAARFVLVGAPDQANPRSVPAIEMAKWADIPGVELWGFRDDMTNVFRQAAVVCLPTTYGEGVPKVLIEAAACGLPLVATDVPGCREVVRPGISGLLVPPGDADALADAISSLLDDREARQQMGRRGREIAVNEFGEQHVVSETLRIYDELLSRKVR